MEFYRDFLVFGLTVCICVFVAPIAIEWTKDWSDLRKQNTVFIISFCFGLFFTQLLLAWKLHLFVAAG